MSVTYFTDFHFLTPAGIVPAEVRAPLGPEVAEALETERLFASDPAPHFTADPRVIDYRLALFRDLDECPALPALLDTFRGQVEILEELCRGDSEGVGADNESCIRDLVLLSIYTGLMSAMREGLEPLSLRSDCLIRLRTLVREITEDAEFIALRDRLAKTSVDIENIKSVTVGINLDAQLRPREAGVVAIHREYFKSGEWIDKLLRLQFRGDDFTCIAPLTATGKNLSAQEGQQLQNALNGALDKILGRSVRFARGNAVRTLRVWCRELLPLLPELTFLTDARRLLSSLRDKGGRICYPTLTTDGSTDIRGLYNPHLLRTLEASQVVSASFSADRDHRAFILTGPNSGGKTVYTIAVALCYLFTGLGMPLPAAAAAVSPAAQIRTHFPGRNANQYRIGRLEEECRHLAEIQAALTPGSVLLMDETFSSTGAEEATALAEKVLDRLLGADCLCIFSTHLHTLARNCADRAGYVTLSAQPGNYRVVPERPGGTSYAEQIARLYGLG